MEKFGLIIYTDNDAFYQNDCIPEITRILRKLADDLEQGEIPRYLYDVNGNKCGKCFGI